jgi:hypothetical protein
VAEEVGVSIYALERSKELRIEGKRLDRDGLSQRAHLLVKEYMDAYPEGHYREAIKLVGRLHAIFLALDPHDYWREVSERGFNDEFWQIKKFIKKPEAPTNGR